MTVRATLTTLWCNCVEASSEDEEEEDCTVNEVDADLGMRKLAHEQRVCARTRLRTMCTLDATARDKNKIRR
jgi:hypothetical protein